MNPSDMPFEAKAKRLLKYAEMQRSLSRQALVGDNGSIALWHTKEAEFFEQIAEALTGANKELIPRVKLIEDYTMPATRWSIELLVHECMVCHHKWDEGKPEEHQHGCPLA